MSLSILLLQIYMSWHWSTTQGKTTQIHLSCVCYIWDCSSDGNVIKLCMEKTCRNFHCLYHFLNGKCGSKLQVSHGLYSCTEKKKMYISYSINSSNSFIAVVSQSLAYYRQTNNRLITQLRKFYLSWYLWWKHVTSFSTRQFMAELFQHYDFCEISFLGHNKRP
jgi:hypothetical protein